MSTKVDDVQSMIGIAHEYANPELVEQEEGAFERAIAEKYAMVRQYSLLIKN